MKTNYDKTGIQIFSTFFPARKNKNEYTKII